MATDSFGLPPGFELDEGLPTIAQMPSAPDLSAFQAPSAAAPVAPAMPSLDAGGGLMPVLTSGTAKGRAAGWARNDSDWLALDSFQKAAAMALMEADGRDPVAARNALGAMINRAAKNNEDLGLHVSQKIYQPTIEPAQRARLRSIVGTPQHDELIEWAKARAEGLEPDPVDGATHFLAHERVMERLRAREPNKYKSWVGWTGYDRGGGAYSNPDGTPVFRDKSHAFLAPEGRYESTSGPAPGRMALGGPKEDTGLPPGFELDALPAGFVVDNAGLPPGFELDKPTEKEGFFSGLWKSLSTGAQQTGSSVVAAGGAYAGSNETIDKSAAFARDLKKSNPQSLTKFESRVEAKKAEYGDTVWGGIKNVASAAYDNPEGVLQFVVQQAPNSVVALGAGFGGAAMGTAVAGPLGTIPGFIAGLFLGNTALETGGKAQEEANKDGTISDEQRRGAMKEGAVKGAVITGVDTATLGASRWIFGTGTRAVEAATTKALIDKGIDPVASATAIKLAQSEALAASKGLPKDQAVRNMADATVEAMKRTGLAADDVVLAVKEAQENAIKLTNGTAKRAGRVGAAISLETLGEGVGEYLGELAATGKSKPTDAVLEALAGLTMSVTEVSAAKKLAANGLSPMAKALQATEPGQPSSPTLALPAPSAANRPEGTAAAPAADATVSAPGQAPAPATIATPQETSALIQQGWSLEDVVAMPRAQVDAEVAQFIEQGGIMPAAPEVPVVATAEPGETAEAEKAGKADEPPVPAGQMTFKTAKGSTYRVQSDGTTIRDKAARNDPGHEGDQGIKPASQRTVYVSDDDANLLGEFQIESDVKRALAFTGDGKMIGVKYLSGKDAGKIERRTAVSFKTDPEVGLTPVELWKDGTRVHFGNKIVEVSSPAAKSDGSRSAPVKIETPQDLAVASERVAEPTEAQKDSGNYSKKHVKFQGLDITIENPKGSMRRGKAPDGSAWEVAMPAEYGYAKRSLGRDGDQVDVYIGEDVASDRVYVIDQVSPEKPGKLDEHKAMLGFASQDAALETYRKAFSDGKADSRVGGITEMGVDEFKSWLAKGKRTRPLSKLGGIAAKEPANEPATPADTPEQAVAPAIETSTKEPDKEPDKLPSEQAKAETPQTPETGSFDSGPVPTFADAKDVVKGQPKPMTAIAEYLANKDFPGSPRGWAKLTDAQRREAFAELKTLYGPEAKAEVVVEPTKAPKVEAAKADSPRAEADSPSKDADTTRSEPGQLLIGSGDVLKSRSGREMSPAPKIDGTSNAKSGNSIRRMNAWLHAEALAEVDAKASGRRNILGEDGDKNYLRTILAGINPAKATRSDKDTLNDILFGDPDGATQDNLVRRGTDKATPAPKVESTNTSEPKSAFVPQDGWRKNVFKARAYAKAIEIDHKGVKLADLVKAIDAKVGTPVSQAKPANATTAESGVTANQEAEPAAKPKPKVDLEKMFLRVPVQVSGSDEEVMVRMNAKDAIEASDQRIRSLHKLMECLAG